MLEKIILILLGFSFFLGTWHAFPMLTVINDEAYAVSGVLRAIENRTVIPQPADVPYGTLVYFVNYFVMGFLLLALLPLFKFNILNLKIFLIQSPWLAYLASRLLHAVLALGFLFLVNKILKNEIKNNKIRLFLLVLLFTNIITSLILHTGKVWVSSAFLVLASFYFLYRSFCYQEGESRESLQKNIFLSILFSFLAFGNFIFSVFALINIPIFIAKFRKHRDILYKIGFYSLAGIFVLAVMFALNFNGAKGLFVDMSPSFLALHQTTKTASLAIVLRSFAFNLQRIIILFPLLLLTLLAVGGNKIKNKRLFTLALIYFIVYLLLISAEATWVLDLQNSFRYLFLLGFFILFIIASFEFKFKKIFYLVGIASFVYFIFTIYYLSAPTTYNQAYDWITLNLNNKDIVIINRMGELGLPKNKQSYLLNEDRFCRTKCRNVIAYDLNSQFQPLVIDVDSRKEAPPLSRDSVVYYIEDSLSERENMKLIKTFENGVGGDFYYSVDYRLGTYFDLNYFKIKRLGRNVYLYKLAPLPI